MLSGKESACNAGDMDTQVQTLVENIPWRRKWQTAPVFFPGKSMDRGAWWATVHGVEMSWVLLATTAKTVTTVNWTFTGLRCYIHIVSFNSYLKPMS